MNPIEMRNRSLTEGRGARSRIAMAALTILAVFSLVSSALAVPGTEGGDTGKTRKKVRVVSVTDMPFLGVNMQELDAEILKGLDASVKQGVLVTEVVDGSPAEEAGIEDGDIIVAFDRNDVESPSGLKKLVEESRVGDTVRVKVIRNGEPQVMKVTVGQRPEDETWDLAAPEAFHWIGDGENFLKMNLGRGRLGVKITDLNQGLAPYFGVEEGEGVLVLDVVEGSAAEKMGIEAGDVIVKVQDEKIGSTDELTEAVAELETGEKVDVSVVRSKKDLTLHGEAGENLAEHYMKVLRMEPDKHMNKIEKFDMRGVPDVEMKKMRKEMDQMKKELEKVREELEKVKEAG